MRCLDCGILLFVDESDGRSARRKRCMPCAQKVARAKSARYNRILRHGDGSVKTEIMCDLCGVVVPVGPYGGNRKYCPDCAGTRRTERMRQANVESRQRRTRTEARLCSCGCGRPVGAGLHRLSDFCYKNADDILEHSLHVKGSAYTK